MDRIRIAAVTLALFWLDAVSQAQVTEVVWGGTTGVRTWQENGNWIGGVFPNDSLKKANLSVNLGANLTARFGATNITVAGVKLGGTSEAVTTSITSTGGLLVLLNGLSTSAAPTIQSTGIPGSVNSINAPIHLVNQQLEISGPTSLTINGNMTYAGGPGPGGASNAAMSAIDSDLTVTVNGSISITNSDGNAGLDFRINNHPQAQGAFVMNGIIQGEGDLQIGSLNSGSLLPLGTVHLVNANTYSGSVRVGRGNLILGHNDSLGSATYRHDGPANQFGYNMIADEDRVISNEIVFAEWQTIKGEHSIEFDGHLTQTRNRGIINLLPATETVTISGDLDIWEDDEVLERRFVVDGTGKTLITGNIYDDPFGTTGQDRRLQKTGTGVLVINTAAGDNNHSGAEVVLMGNWHYANNDSLNVSFDPKAKILSIGGAVGVDTHPVGQNITTNALFISKFDFTSTGGLMLAPADANVNISFNSPALFPVENMSLAAPEGGLTYTGTLTPNANQYRLGGGTGTLTLPNAQLTGATRSLSVRNGGTVRLLGDNSYGGPTTIESKYSSTNQEQAAADSNNTEVAQNIFIDRLVAPVLEVDTLANGGSNSSIGASSSAAANLYIHGSTLRYIGTGSTTERLFTIGTAGATLDASGAGPLVFSNGGAAVTADAADITGTLDDFAGNPNVISNVSNSRDIIIGMSINDPDPANPATDFTQPPCEADGANCIPLDDPNSPGHPVTVTSVSSDGKSISVSANYPFIYKENTRLVLGTVDRTLTLSGTNLEANILRPVIGNSAKGGEVNIVKTGSGTWLLEGVNTTTGATTVEQGTLGGNGGVGGNLTVHSGATFAPGGTGGSSVGDFSVGGSFTLNAGAALAVQVSGLGAGNVDLLEVADSATLSGTFILSALAFSPAMGNQFTVLTAASGVVGTFDATQLPTLDVGLTWTVHYEPISVWLEVVAGRPGDYNNDGTVDAADYVVWRKTDGSQQGYDTWRANFGRTAGAGAAGSATALAAAPEPETFALVALVSALLATLRPVVRHNVGLDLATIEFI